MTVRHCRFIYLVIVLALALLMNLTVSATSGFAADAGSPSGEHRSATLAGIQAVGLTVSAKLADPDLIQRLNDQLRSLAERRLASCGLVITSAEAAQSAGQPVLAIAIAPQRGELSSQLEATLNVWDFVHLSRAPDQFVRLPVWDKRVALAWNADKDDITNHVTGLLDSFMADYSVANPRTQAAADAQSGSPPPGSLRGVSPQVVPLDITTSLSGTWDSTYGTVTLHQGERENSGLVPVSGYWVEANVGQRGQIQQGQFDPRTRTLTFSFYLPWHKDRGKAIMKLSADGRTLDGTRRTGGLHKWKWTMWR